MVCEPEYMNMRPLITDLSRSLGAHCVHTGFISIIFIVLKKCYLIETIKVNPEN